MINNVKKPNHYQREGLPECKEVIANILKGYSEFLSEKEIFWLGNAIKYIYRAPLKNKREDIEKACEYMSWLVKNEKYE